MSKLSFRNGSRIIAGLAVASAFVVAPMAAQATPGPGDLEGTLSPGSLVITTPTFDPLSTTLTGFNQTLDTAVGGWSVTDATGSNAGYNVTVAASAPTVDGSIPDAGTGGSITYTPQTISEASGNPAAAGPVDGSGTTNDQTPVPLSSTPATVANAPAGDGQGEWDFAADSGSTKSLQVVIPGNASAGTYSSTLTFTTAPPIN